MGFHNRRFKWLLRLLPPSFREDHEAEMLRVWCDEQRDAAREGREGVWRSALKDTIRVAPREHLEVWRRNLGLAIRRLRRSPAFALTAILTLALGTGAAAAVFSLVNAVLLRPLPWRSPETVGLIWAVQPSGERTWLSFAELDDLRRELGTLVAVAGVTDLRPQFVAAGIGQELQALAVSHSFFQLLGVAPTIGRDFARDDDQRGAGSVVILSDAFWRSQFGADPSVVGRSIVLNERSCLVIGVLPATFSILPPTSVLPDRVDVWVPLEPHLPSRDRSVRFLHVLGRLRDQVGFAEAGQELQRYAERVRREFASSYPEGVWGFTIQSFADDVLEDARRVLYLLFGLVALVLVMACANVANLLLVRGEARRTELAIRTALGAGPTRLAGELLAEALVLAACGSAVGLGLAAAVPLLLRTLDVGALPRLAEAHVDTRVVTFMMGLLLLTVVLFASVPLIERLRLRSLVVLTGSRSGGLTRRGARIGRLLVIGQTALATTVVVTALFLVETFAQLHRVDLGFEPQGLLTARISLSPKYQNGPAAVQFFDTAITAVIRVPGVVSAAAVTQLPLSGAMLGSTFLVGAGPDSRRINADLRGVTPKYFDVIGTPLLSGRQFTDSDSASSPPVAIIDESFARRFASNASVIGMRIRWFRQPDVDIEIVGVARSLHHRGAGFPQRETVYRPHRQYARPSMFLVVKTQQDAASASSAVSAAVASIDASQPFADVATMDQRLGRSMSRTRVSMMLATVLAGISLSLALVGLYGVLSFGVAQRRREFAVRMALGASPAGVRRLVLRDGLLLTGVGAVLGALGAIAVAGLIRGLLFGTGLTDLRQYVYGVALVLTCSVAAFWLPARRASATHPMTTLRAD